MSLMLLKIGADILVYGGFVLFIIGIVGNGINIYTFSSDRTYRSTPCAFYFLIASICNIFYITINLPTRILSAGYGIDWTNTFAFWCKGRTFLMGFLALTSMTCSCLAAIDQYLVTSRTVRLRQCSQIKWAHRIVLIAMLVWFLHGIPVFFFLNISPITNLCITTNSIYLTYISLYILVLICAIPVVVMVVFGSLAYRNLCQTIVLAQQHADRQMTMMTLIQVVLIVISNSPFGVFNAYTLITARVPKSLDRQVNEAFAAIILILISYFYYVGNFYMFLISSNRFRRTVKKKIFRKRQANQISPLQQFNF